MSSAREAYAASITKFRAREAHKEHREALQEQVTLVQPTNPDAHPVVWSAEEREHFKQYGTASAAPMSTRTNNQFWWAKTAPGGGFWNASSLVGNMMDLAWESGAQSPEEFMQYYFKTFTTLDNLIELADAYRAHCARRGQALSRTEALNEYLVHLIDETFAGYRSEVAVMDWLNAQEKHAPLTWQRVHDKRWDNGFAIDLILGDSSQDDGFKLAVQVKPKSFWWKSPKFDSVKIREAKKHKQAELKGKRVWFVNKDDLATFGKLSGYTHWSELVLSDGRPITEVVG